MTRREIERFFTALSRTWKEPLEVILIGGAAAVLAGSVRPTYDVDFEARPGGPSGPEDGDLLASAVNRATTATGVEAQFSQDIDRWGEVVMPPYRETAQRWRSFGRITVRLLEPSVYAVSKLRRGAEKDFEDIILVGRATGLSWKGLARSAGWSVRKSPMSTLLNPFIRRVDYFFRVHGRELWGERFKADEAMALFRQLSVRSRKRERRATSRERKQSMV